MSDRVFEYPEFRCYCCGNTLRVSENGSYVFMECPKCDYHTRYTMDDYNKALQIRKEAEAREKEREKHYEL